MSKLGTTTKRPRKVLRGNIRGITKPAIQRLAHQAGVKSFSGLIYERIRGVLLDFLNTIVQKTLFSMVYARRRTLEWKDLKLALEVQHEVPRYKYLIAEPDLNIKTTTSFHTCKVGPTSSTTKKTTDSEGTPTKKTRKTKQGKLAVRKIKFGQEHSDCLVFPQESFRRLVREVAQDAQHGDGVQVRKEYFLLLQLVTEAYLIDLFKSANLATIHCERVELMPKDIDVALAIREEL